MDTTITYEIPRLALDSVKDALADFSAEDVTDEQVKAFIESLRTSGVWLSLDRQD